jgi:hypothetical protein
VLGCHPPANEKAGKYLIPNGKRKADLAWPDLSTPRPDQEPHTHPTAQGSGADHRRHFELPSRTIKIQPRTKLPWSLLGLLYRVSSIDYRRTRITYSRSQRTGSFWKLLYCTARYGTLVDLYQNAYGGGESTDALR